MSMMGIRTIGDLKLALKNLPDDSQIRVLDGFNGSGMGRVINLGPVRRIIYSDKYNKEFEDVIDDNDNHESRESEIDKAVYVIGYGCY